ncbi:MAG: Lrp/AsnC family transcriptional regulator [Pseudomonadales bacterium]
MSIDSSHAILDDELLELLRRNSRESITNLAKQLSVSRATVQEHMRRLERRNIIQGYTIRFQSEYQQQLVNACVMISIIPRNVEAIVHTLSTQQGIESIQTISGQYDLLVLVNARTTELLDQQIDRITAVEGVEQTVTSIVLAKKFQR